MVYGAMRRARVGLGQKPKESPGNFPHARHRCTRSHWAGAARAVSEAVYGISITACAISTLLVTPTVALAQTGRALVAEPVQGEKIRIDGDLREWPSKMTPLAETLQGSSPPEARTVVGYDDKNVYLALRVHDKNIARTAQASDAEDHATLTLAFPRGRLEYTTYEVDVFPGKPGKLPGVVKLRGKPLAGAKAVENPTERELLIEAQIPWASFPEAARVRVGLRGSVSYTNADNPGTVKAICSTSTGRSGKGLGPLLLEAEQGLADLVREKGLSDLPARETYGNVAGDGTQERVAVYGPYITISGPGFRGGKEFYFAEIGASSADMIRGLELSDFDGDGRDEIVIRKRVGSKDKYREMLDVMKVGKDDAPFVAFSHEIAIKTPDGSITNKVKIANRAITVEQGQSDGFEADSYAEPLPGGNVHSALLPWESVGSRTFKWQGNGFVKSDEQTESPKLSKKEGGKKHRSDANRPAEPPPPRPPTADEMLDRVYALYKKERSASGRPRFDFVTDVAADSSPERVVVHGKDIVVFGKNFRSGASYAFIQMGVADEKDVIDATARDLTGDGKAEIVVRAVLRAKASKALGGDTVERHALLVYGIKEERLARVFAAETGRALGKNQILGVVAFEPASRGTRIELRPGRAIGWTENSYPFPPDTTTAGGLEPLLLPWSGNKRAYHYNGSEYVLE
ncbi:MAG TPA: hypothetical protein VFQ61_38520 [Polyangiaceae bacterium]|nr:hypothetical protein [Polyangiaceae bacterium]